MERHGYMATTSSSVCTHVCVLKLISKGQIVRARGTNVAVQSPSARIPGPQGHLLPALEEPLSI